MPRSPPRSPTPRRRGSPCSPGASATTAPTRAAATGTPPHGAHRGTAHAAPAAPPLASGDMAEFDRLVLSLTEQAEAVDAPASRPHRQANDTSPACAHAPSRRGRSSPRRSRSPSARRRLPRRGRQARRSRGVPRGRRRSGIARGPHRRARHDRAVDGSGTASTVFRRVGGEARSRRSVPRSRERSGSARLDGVVLSSLGSLHRRRLRGRHPMHRSRALALGVPDALCRGLRGSRSPVPLLDVVARFGRRRCAGPKRATSSSSRDPRIRRSRSPSGLAGWVGLPPTAVVLAGEIDAIRGHGRRIRDEDQAQARCAHAPRRPGSLASR